MIPFCHSTLPKMKGNFSGQPRAANAMAVVWRLICAVAWLSTVDAGVKVKKAPKVEIDESKLPPFAEVLAELGLSDVLPALEAKGLDSTRQFCKWTRSDISIHGMELGCVSQKKMERPSWE